MSTPEQPKDTAPFRAPRTVRAGEHAGQRIDNFLLRHLKTVPKSRVYRMLRKGEVRVNGGRVKPTYRLKDDDEVRIPPHRAIEQPDAFIGDRQLAELERRILFEDKDLLVLDKPAGLAAHGGSGVSFGAVEALRRLRPDATLELAHRLDRDTSGCLLLAKRRPALRRLHELMRSGGLNKRYRLIVSGRWPDTSTRVRLPLLRYLTPEGERRVRVDAAGKPSVTIFTRLEVGTRASLLEAELVTGRTHQIRVHAAASGHAILGDPKYADAEAESCAQALGIRHLCLHACSVELPWAEGTLEFVSPSPPVFDAAWQAARDAPTLSGRDPRR